MKSMIKTCFFTVIISLQCLTIAWGQASVLSQGVWYKVAVTEDGIYKIDHALLQSMGVNPTTVNPLNLKVYGNGGKMLPQSNAEPRPVDLVENAIFYRGNSDANWSADEFFLFYGQGPDQIHYLSEENAYRYEQNIYSDTSYYFIQLGTSPGKRMASQANLGSGFTKITHYDDLAYHELDRLSVLSSGRSWYGERMASPTTETAFDYSLANVAIGKQLEFFVKVMAQTYLPASFDFLANGELLGNKPIDSILDAAISPYADKGRETSFFGQINVAELSGNSLRFTIRFNPATNTTRSTGYLDNVLVTIPRNLNVVNRNSLIFSTKESLQNPFSNFEIAGTDATTQVWDLSNPLNPLIQQTQQNGTLLNFVVQTNSLKKWAVVKGSSFPNPRYIKRVVNQNLRAAAVPDMLLVAHPQLLAEANRLADHRSAKDGLQILIAGSEQVFNEFSGGSQDVCAIRDLAKHLYDQNPQKFRYLLLFGDASFDFKNHQGDNKIQLIGYQSRVSLHPVYTYASDDFFGFLENHEGDWQEGVNTFVNHTLDIGIGRLPAQTLAEAQNMVDKIIHYDTSPRTLGPWRTDVLFVADDGDSNRHQLDAEILSQYLDTAFAQFNSKKIYLDAYQRVQQGNTERYPEASQAIEDYVEKGILLVNFTGHGSEDRWTHESVLTKAMITQWRNKDRLPLFVTATCEFGRHDDPSRLSGAEMLLIEKEKGAIALLTTSRPVLSSSNFRVNQSFTQHVFRKVNGDWPRLGDVIKATKNESLEGVNNRNFILLGDPSMKLAYPNHSFMITKINDDPLNRDMSLLRSLDKVKVEGIVVDPAGNFLPSFNGTMQATVYDKTTKESTLGNGSNVSMSFVTRNSVIFRGEASVNNGVFNFEFMVPRNINYTIDRGKIGLYALQNNSLEDAGGATIDFMIGGSNNEAAQDNTPPQIQLFMNDSTFRNGGKTAPDARIVAKISDESGINISLNGFGQEIRAELNNNGEVFILNDFFVSSLDTYQEGWVRYPVRNLPLGKNTLTLKAWDSYNNSNETFLEFYVLKNGELSMERIFNFPNPFQDFTEITFEHNRGGDPLEIEIRIFNQQGQFVQSLSGNIERTETQIKGISWDATDSHGKKVPNGIYFLKLLVRSGVDGAKNELSHKMIVLN